jgi:hypothetical protein
MATRARLTNIEAIKEFRATLIKFVEEATVAVNEAQSEVLRVQWWLRNEQVRHWERQIRRRNEKIAQAKSELFRAQLSAQQSGGSCYDEKRALKKAEAALEEAHQKVKHSRKWASTLDRELLLYKGQMQQLSTLLAGELPVAVAKMERMMQALEAYVSMAPAARRDEGGGLSIADKDLASMARAVAQVQGGPFSALRAAAPKPDDRAAHVIDHPQVEPETDRLLEPTDPNLLRRLKLEGQYVSLSDKVLVAKGVLDLDALCLVRASVPDVADSGWTLLPYSRELAAPDAKIGTQTFTAMDVAGLLAQRPASRDALCLPAGYVAVLEGDVITAVVSPIGVDVLNDPHAEGDDA